MAVSPSKPVLWSTEDLDIAVAAAQRSQAHALRMTDVACGLMFPFGTDGGALCPVTGCWQPVHQHLGFPDQR